MSAIITGPNVSRMLRVEQDSVESVLLPAPFDPMVMYQIFMLIQRIKEMHFFFLSKDESKLFIF
jgi:hypothetical protein